MLMSGIFERHVMFVLSVVNKIMIDLKSVSSPNQSRTCDLSIITTSPDALPQSYRSTHQS